MSFPFVGPFPYEPTVPTTLSTQPLSEPYGQWYEFSGLIPGMQSIEVLFPNQTNVGSLWFPFPIFPITCTFSPAPPYGLNQYVLAGVDPELVLCPSETQSVVVSFTATFAFTNMYFFASQVAFTPYRNSSLFAGTGRGGGGTNIFFQELSL